MNTTAWAEIQLHALQHNARLAKALAPETRLMAMIKGDAYGHGLLRAASSLIGIADGLAVARLHEALALREAGIQSPILLLGTLLDNHQLALCARHQLGLVVHDLRSAQQVVDSHLERPLDIWLKLNSGMNRLGLSETEFALAQAWLSANDNVRSLTHMTHFSSADDVDSLATARQIDTMWRVSRAQGEYPVSMANSAGIIAHPKSHAQWIRPGIMLYGDNPVRRRFDLDLRQVMQFKARVIALHQLRAGDSVGYNATWTATTDTRIAVLGVGYADGYPRHAPSGTPVLINGERAALAGRVSMDIISVDIGALRGPVAIGDEALLWGEELPAWEIAEAAGTISYQLYTGVTARVPRIYQSS